MENKQVVIRWERKGTEDKVLELFIKDIYEALALNENNYEGLEAFRREINFIKWNTEALLARLYERRVQEGK
jgi:hypothetical protein